MSVETRCSVSGETEILDRALAEAQKQGYEFSQIYPDGRFHRAGPKMCQWYIAWLIRVSHSEQILVGTYGDWRTGEKLRFQSKKENLTPEQQAELKLALQRAAEEEQRARKINQDETAKECQRKWETLDINGISPYLTSKGISDVFGARIQGETLYIPVRNIKHEIRSFQQIQADGQKYFFPGGETKGCFHIIGEIEKGSEVYVAEGFATAASIHMATGGPVVVAFNADNLIVVSELLKNEYLGKKFIICGDDDRWTNGAQRNAKNPGREKALKAAQLIGGTAIFPRFRDLSTRPTDFNDLYCLEGLEEVGEQIRNSIELPQQNEAASLPKKNPSQTEILLELAEAASLFHTPEREGFATVPVRGHLETWPLKSPEFRNWLLREYFLSCGTSPTKEAMQNALNVLGARAQFDSDMQQVFLRIAEHDGNIYVDLTNDQWQVVKVSKSGFEVLDNSPVKFRRSPQMRPLPYPISTQSDECVAILRRFLNIDSKADLKLIISWIINAFNPRGPYLVLVLYGEQGCAKSTNVRVIRDLIDPSEAPLRREPRNSDDLMVSTKGNWIVAVDNLSFLPDWLSDDLCRLSTGGGLSKRQLYSDDDERVLNAKRPIILNGIDEFVARGDLASRTIIINLPVINEGERKREKAFWEEFSSAKAQLLGGLLLAISEALKCQDTFELTELPRMADAWHWISAAETAFGWVRGSALEAFRANQSKSNDAVLANSPIFPVIRDLARAGWSGTASDLLSKVNVLSSPLLQHERSWPKTPKALSDRIRRINPALRNVGIDVSFEKSSGSDSKRIINLRNRGNSCDANVAQHSF